MGQQVDNRLKALIATVDAMAAAAVVFVISGDLRSCLLFTGVTYAINLANQSIAFLPDTAEKLSGLLSLFRGLWGRLFKS
jgi:hypothetical protein